MKNILVLKKSHSLKDVIKVIDENSEGFLILVEEDYTLVGIITDGDLRRSINNNLLDKKVKLVMRTNPLLISEDELSTEALRLMNDKKIRVAN